MPTIESVTVNYGKLGTSKYDIFNVTAPVGSGMPNHFGDVMVIQALLNFICTNKSTAGASGVKAENMPIITGLFDDKTANAISAFQGFCSPLLLNTDGKIHPGSFKNRILRMAPPYMTITLLNDNAREAARFNVGDWNHTEPILRNYPQLRMAIIADLQMV